MAVGNSGGADNNISITFDKSSKDPQSAQQKQINASELPNDTSVASGAGVNYPAAGVTTKNTSTGDVPGGRPEGGKDRQGAGGASM